MSLSHASNLIGSLALILWQLYQISNLLPKSLRRRTDSTRPEHSTLPNE
jgi:hypothetical protein